VCAPPEWSAHPPEGPTPTHPCPLEVHPKSKKSELQPLLKENERHTQRGRGSARARERERERERGGGGSHYILYNDSCDAACRQSAGFYDREPSLWPASLLPPPAKTSEGSSCFTPRARWHSSSTSFTSDGPFSLCTPRARWHSSTTNKTSDAPSHFVLHVPGGTAPTNKTSDGPFSLFPPRARWRSSSTNMTSDAPFPLFPPRARWRCSSTKMTQIPQAGQSGKTLTTMFTPGIVSKIATFKGRDCPKVLPPSHARPLLQKLCRQRRAC
jgi:hypothetical protein